MWAGSWGLHAGSHSPIHNHVPARPAWVTVSAQAAPRRAIRGCTGAPAGTQASARGHAAKMELYGAADRSKAGHKRPKISIRGSPRSVSRKMSSASPRKPRAGNALTIRRRFCASAGRSVPFKDAALIPDHPDWPLVMYSAQFACPRLSTRPPCSKTSSRPMVGATHGATASMTMLITTREFTKCLASRAAPAGFSSAAPKGARSS